MPRDAVSRTANVERTGRHKWVNPHAEFFSRNLVKLNQILNGFISLFRLIWCQTGFRLLTNQLEMYNSIRFRKKFSVCNLRIKNQSRFEEFEFLMSFSKIINEDP